MSFHVPNEYRLRSGPIGSDPDIGNNGAFMIQIQSYELRIIASDGMGWEHVSVSIKGSTRSPSWDMMCKIKDIFWDNEDVVVQYHPPKSEYVNYHPGCLHLWRPIELKMPRPNPVMVGPNRRADD